MTGKDQYSVYFLNYYYYSGVEQFGDDLILIFFLEIIIYLIPFYT